MAFLEENCVLNILTDDILEECHPFVCGDDDMDEFFQKDALDYTRYRMGKSYCFRMKDDTQTIVACFTVSNDSIRIYDLPSSRRNAMWGIINRESFYEHNGFKPLFPREVDEDFYTKPPKDDEEREERMKNPRKLRTRLMFSDLLDE